MEPNKPVTGAEAREIGTDDDEGPVHCTIPHNRLEDRGLSDYNVRLFKHHTVYMSQAHHTRC